MQICRCLIQIEQLADEASTIVAYSSQTDTVSPHERRGNPEDIRSTLPAMKALDQAVCTSMTVTRTTCTTANSRNASRYTVTSMSQVNNCSASAGSTLSLASGTISTETPHTNKPQYRCRRPVQLATCNSHFQFQCLGNGIVSPSMQAFSMNGISCAC